MVEPPKTKLVNLRVPPDELAAWQARAADASMTLTAWIRTKLGPGTMIQLRRPVPAPVRTLTPGAATPKRKDK